MRWIRVASAVVNQTPLDWQGNLRRIRDAVQEARRQGVQFLCLPELSLTGYGCEDAFHSVSHSQRAMRHLADLAKSVHDMILVVGAPIRLQTSLYNCAVFVAGGEVAAIIAKEHLAGDGIHYEPRWFRSWPEGDITSFEFEGKKVPFGDLVLNFGGIRVGAEICEDAWVPNRVSSRLGRAGVDIIAGPSASHFSFGKFSVRERIVAEGSRSTGAAYLYANALGNESGRVVYEGQRVIASAGEIVARSELFTFKEFALTSAVIDVDLLRMKRARTMSLRTSDEGFHIVDIPWKWNESGTKPDKPIGGATDWRAGDHVKEEEFARAVSLALFDYLRKSHSRGFVVSLSGGADSAAVATLASLAFQFAKTELGTEEVQRRLPQVKVDASFFGGGLLDTVYQATANSGEETRLAARQVAEGLGARHAEWEVESLVTAYRAHLEESLGRKLTWEDDDIALQNIQSRVRAPGVWMLANVRGSLLLATSNRSEAAVGYATMDGDTAGSLSPIAGIDKNYLRKWLRWIGEQGPEGIGPVAGVLSACNLAPMAELRPASYLQTDEGDLMPYELLDVIERLAIRDRMEPVEVLRNLEAEWVPKVGRDQLVVYIKRFYVLWCRNQWKRERYAPTFHVDDENLDPKTWCRFPILSGGFVEEMGELEC